MVRNGWSNLQNRFAADIAGLENRLEMSEFAAHLLKPAGGLRCNSLLYGWNSLIQVSFGQVLLITRRLQFVFTKGSEALTA